MSKNQKGLILLSICIAILVGAVAVSYYYNPSYKPVWVQMAINGEDAQIVDVNTIQTFKTNGRNFELTVIGDNKVLLFVDGNKKPITCSRNFQVLEDYYGDIAHIEVIAKK